MTGASSLCRSIHFDADNLAMAVVSGVVAFRRHSARNPCPDIASSQLLDAVGDRVGPYHV